jgi:hypothetical protein
MSYLAKLISAAAPRSRRGHASYASKRPTGVVQWKRGGGDGNWSSHDGRFSISPSYRSRTTPSDYTLDDQKTGGHGRYDTVREAKASAVDILQRELNPPPPQPPPRHEPSLTDSQILEALESNERTFRLAKKYYPETAVASHEERLTRIRTMAGEERWTRLSRLFRERQP